MRLPILLSIVFSTIAADGVSGPISPNFNLWLTANGYESEDFLRADYGTQGSYGGMSSTINRTSNTPVIFCHGNTDTALKTDSFSTGWDATILYFLANGYTQADLYATSWSDNKKANAGKRTHSCFEVTRLRKWVDAVLKYTGSPKVSMVSHSMGVTLMRKVVKGGTITDSDGSTCNLGPGISQQIEVFVGLSGANYGMCNCEGGSAFAEASCNKKNGFWPGDYCGLNSLTCGLHPLPYPCTPSTGVIYSNYLTLLNNDPTKEGDYVFSAWSQADDVIQYQDMTWGHPSSLIPTSTDHKIYQKLTHMQTKEQTYADQYTMVHDKRVPQ